MQIPIVASKRRLENHRRLAQPDDNRLERNADHHGHRRFRGRENVEGTRGERFALGTAIVSFDSRTNDDDARNRRGHQRGQHENGDRRFHLSTRRRCKAFVAPLVSN